MKRLRRLSLSFRRSTRQRHQLDTDSNVEDSSHPRPRAASSDDEALPRRPRRRLTKKRHTQRPSLEARVQGEQSHTQIRTPPSPSPSPPPSLARVPFPPQKRVPPPALPDLSSGSSRPSDSPPTEQVLDPHHDALAILTPSTPPAPTPLSVIVEQDERSLRSAGFSLHSVAGPLAPGDPRDHEHERDYTSGERGRTVSGLSSLKDGSRPGSASDKARSIYERPSAPAPPSPPATPKRELEAQTFASATLSGPRRWASEATAGTSHLVDDAPLEQEEEEEPELNVLPNSNHTPLSVHDQELNDKPIPHSATSLPDQTTTPLPAQSSTSLPSQSLPSQPPASPSPRPTSLPSHLQLQPTFQTDGRTPTHTTPVHAPSAFYMPFAPNPNHSSSPNSSTAHFPHSPTDTDAYATAAESLMGDADEGYTTPVGEGHTTSVGDGEGREAYTASLGIGDNENLPTPAMQFDHDTPTATLRARDRTRSTGAGAAVGDVYQYPPARHTFGLWDVAGAQETSGGVDSGGSEVELGEESVSGSGSGSRGGDQDGEEEQEEEEEGEEEEVSSAPVGLIDDPWRSHTRHGSNSTTSPTPTPTPALPLLAIPNPASVSLLDIVHPSPAPLPHSPPSPAIPVVLAPAPTLTSAPPAVPGSDPVDFPPIPPLAQTPVMLSESVPEIVTLPQTPGSASLPHISESASLPHLSDSVHSLPLPLPPSFASGSPSSHTPPDLSLSLSLSSHSEPEPEPDSVHFPSQGVQAQLQAPRVPRVSRVPVPQRPEARTPSPPASAPTPPTPPSSVSHTRTPRPRALRPHPFLEGHAGEKLGGRGGGMWDVRVSGGEWTDEGERGKRVGDDGDGVGEGGEGEEEQGNVGDGEGETEEDEEIAAQRSVGSKVGDTFADDSIQSQRVGAAGRRAAPSLGQAHPAESSTPLPHPQSSSPTPLRGLHNRPLPTVPVHPPGLPTPTPPRPRLHQASDASASNHTTTAAAISPMTFARRPSLVPAPAPKVASASSSSPPGSSPSSPPPRLAPAASPTAASAPAALSISSSPPLSLSPPSSPPPLSRSASLTRLITSTLTRPARTVLKKRGRTVSSSSGRDGGSSGGRGIEPGFNMVAPDMTGEAYGVEAWHRDNGAEGRSVPLRGAQMARVLVHPPSPLPSSLDGPSQPHPPRQPQFSWAGQEEFTASLVAEYGAMLSPFLATPGNSRPQSYEDHHGGPSGTVSPELAAAAQSGSGEQTLSLRSAEQERAALLAAKPPKRVGRKLSKRRKPVPVPVPVPVPAPR